MTRSARLPSLLVVVSALAALVACRPPARSVGERGKVPVAVQTKVSGEQKAFFGAAVSAWTMLQPDGSIHLAGLTVPLRAIQAAAGSGKSVESLALAMPPQEKKQAFVDHVEVQYHPGIAGDAPFGSGAAYFALRFYGIGWGAEQAIDCARQQPIPPERLPTGLSRADTGSLVGTCVPHAGTVGADVGAAGSMDQPPYGRVLLAYDRGRISMIEAEVTAADLRKKESFTLTIPAPRTLGSGSLLFPSTVTGVYSPARSSYDFSLYGFTDLSGSTSSG